MQNFNSSQQQPLVSVVMPVWNGERYLREAVESILSQTYQRFEMILADDGSEDGCRAVIEQYARADARIRPIYLSHEGVIPTLNAGCAAAQGKYIARLDCDDIALPQRLEIQVDFLESHPHMTMVGSAFQYITAAGGRTNLVSQPVTGNEAIRQRLTQANCFCSSSVTMRTDVFAQSGGYRAALTEAEDYDLWTRLTDYGDVEILDPVLVLYRLHPGQASIRGLEQEALSARAVRIATEQRRRTGKDPLAGFHGIDRSALCELGLSEDEIDQSIISGYLFWFGMMLGLGLGKAVLARIRDVITSGCLLNELDSGAIAVAPCAAS